MSVVLEVKDAYGSNTEHMNRSSKVLVTKDAHAIPASFSKKVRIPTGFVR